MSRPEKSQHVTFPRETPLQLILHHVTTGAYALSPAHRVQAAAFAPRGGWGGQAASRPICKEIPMSMGVPPVHRKVWHEAPGEGSRVWSEAPMQRMLCSRGSTSGCPTAFSWSSTPGPVSRPEAPHDFSLRGEVGEFGDSRLAWNKWIQVQRLDGRRFTPSGVGSR